MIQTAETAVKSTPVESFAPEGSEAERLLQYPFARPEGSFFTNGYEVTTLPSDYDAFCQAADDMLTKHGLPLLSERVPVVAYGANVSPAKFEEKMRKYGSPSVQPELQAVPMLMVDVPNSQVVWHGKPGQAGSVFSELFEGPETQGKTAHAALQFMTTEQVALMHATEGVTYHFTPVDVQTKDGVLIHAVAYVAGQSSMLLKDGKPVSMKVTPNDTTEGMTAREAVAYMLEHAGQALGIEAPEELIALNAGKKLIEKKANQSAIETVLREQGLSAEFSHPAQQDWYYGRADFNELNHVGHNPRLLHLAEESLARIRPSKQDIDEATMKIMAATAGMSEQEARRKARAQLDIMQVLRGRHRAELQERLDNQAIEKSK